MPALFGRTVGHTETAGISRITFVVHVADEKETEQLTKQLNKQIDVLKVTDITNLRAALFQAQPLEILFQLVQPEHR